MQITVNGESIEFPESELNLTAVLKQQQVESPEMVAVQVNGEFIDKSEFDARTLEAGDSVEFLYFMGGGCGA